MASTGSASNIVRAVGRALDLLELLAESQSGITLSSLCQGTDLNSSTAHRLLSTLAARGYVHQDPTSKQYYLGPRALHLGQAAQVHFDLRSIAMDHLRQLVHETNELANLALLADTHAVYLAQVRAEQRAVHMFTQLGARVRLHCTGVGKAMLAFMPEGELEQFFATEQLDAYTVNTITNVFQLRESLEEIRRRGYAVDDEEREIGVRCLAAPVFQAGGRVIASVSISGPPGRVSADREQELSALVLKAAAEISNRLGYGTDDMSHQDPISTKG